MNITVINGTEKHGVTYRLKEMFLAEFKDRASITEYDLPKDCPNFCNGCVSCIIKGESTCKDAEYIGRMYMETKGRPIYIEKESNIDEDKERKAD